MKSPRIDRRNFLISAAVAGLGTRVQGTAGTGLRSAPASGMRMGLVTYQWGRDWDLPTVIANCEKARFQGVELRTEHAHGVEPVLTGPQRKEVRSRFEDSAIECVGYGSNQEYHSPDPAELKRQIEGTYELIKLCHDIGSTGLKVKPNTLPEGVEAKKTIEQIGTSLNKVGKYAADFGQKIRVEVHGRKTAEPAIMKAIFDYVEEPSVGACWNCNEQDLLPPGLEYNFNLIKNRFGDTVHIHELDSPNYPYKRFFELLLQEGYQGWILLEASSEPADRVAAMADQLSLFNQLVGR